MSSAPVWTANWPATWSRKVWRASNRWLQTRRRLMAHNAVEKFTIAVPDQVLADLRERLARTRLPGEVRDSGWTYGTNLAYLKELIEYWRSRYDWRKHERDLNAFSHYKVTINDCPIHFIHQPGAGSNPTPLLLLHGWPGSIAEFQQIIPMLT